MDVSSISNLAGNLTAVVEAQAPAAAAPGQRQLIQAVKAVNAAEMFGQNNELTFVMDRASRRAVVRIVNRNTHEVVRQIPSEYVLRLAEESSRG